MTFQNSVVKPSERHPLIQSIEKEYIKKEVFQKGDKTYTREKPPETSESVVTGYGIILIMPNQEGDWVHQVVRNIPSPALSIQWDNSDFEAKKNVNRSSKSLR